MDAHYLTNMRFAFAYIFIFFIINLYQIAKYYSRMCSRFTPSEFVPLPASPVHHIIWNIVLTDKLVELTP
jgi:hypothetical protein